MEVHKILGPPGTGKTFTLMGIMRGELERGVPPDRIAFLTFTTHARRIALQEAGKNFGYVTKDLPYFRTLHSICFKQHRVRRENMVRDQRDLIDFARRQYIDMTVPSDLSDDFDDLDHFSRNGRLEGDRMLEFDHWRRHRMLPVTRQSSRMWSDELDFWELKRFSEAYAEYKERESLVDFTDLLSLSIEPIPVDVVFVDEAQDLSPLQWDVLDRISKQALRMYVAGDDDQAIFCWAGASPEHFIDLPAKTRLLRQSYRLPRAVHAAAVRISSRIDSRIGKAFNPRDAAGSFRRVQEFDDVQIRHGEDWLVLVRNHYAAGAVHSRLRELGIPYTYAGRPAWTPGAREAVGSVLRLASGGFILPADLEAVRPFLRVEASADRRIRDLAGSSAPDANIDRRLLEEAAGRSFVWDSWGSVLERISPSECRFLGDILKRSGDAGLVDSPTVRVSTIHAAKGDEAKNVALLAESSRKVRLSAESDPDQELRVQYVGATRASDQLVMVGESDILAFL